MTYRFIKPYIVSAALALAPAIQAKNAPQNRFQQPRFSTVSLHQPHHVTSHSILTQQPLEVLDPTAIYHGMGKDMQQSFKRTYRLHVVMRNAATVLTASLQTLDDLNTQLENNIRNGNKIAALATMIDFTDIEEFSLPSFNVTQQEYVKRKQAIDKFYTLADIQKLDTVLFSIRADGFAREEDLEYPYQRFSQTPHAIDAERLYTQLTAEDKTALRNKFISYRLQEQEGEPQKYGYGDLNSAINKKDKAETLFIGLLFYPESAEIKGQGIHAHMFDPQAINRLLLCLKEEEYQFPLALEPYVTNAHNPQLTLKPQKVRE